MLLLNVAFPSSRMPWLPLCDIYERAGSNKLRNVTDVETPIEESSAREEDNEEMPDVQMLHLLRLDWYWQASLSPLYSMHSMSR